jgi:hypothetical protein
MQTFHCECGATLFFDNTRCLRCGRALGYLPDLGVFSALEPAHEPEVFVALAARAGPERERSRVRKCRNYAVENVCNWMVAHSDPDPYCLACRLNDTIPNLSTPGNRVYWAKIEAAKRRLVYSILRLGLPLESRHASPERGLAFAFLENAGPEPKVMTGHAHGLITINIAEADEVEREQTRRQMQEPYRTLLGHFRHESGHYYWDRLVRDSSWIEPFRALFGDERQDYADALKRHYESGGGGADWRGQYISGYAAAHPWEDWAETWAHYLHMIDTLETSRAFGMSPDTHAEDLIDEQLFGTSERTSYTRNPPPEEAQMAKLLREWIWLSISMNAINRSMGMRDAYPFVLNPVVAKKLQLVHNVIARANVRPSENAAVEVEAPLQRSG